MTIPIDATKNKKPRARLRDAVPGVYLGAHKPGPLNAITDVSGVLVHTQEIRSDDGSVNTGVTTILPRKDWFNKACYAGIFRYNGAGELTGSHWIEETGLLHSPIVITGTFSVGHAFQGILQHAVREHRNEDGDIDVFFLPVVGGTFDGFLSDLAQFAVKAEHIVDGIDNAVAGPVAEGNRGGGTGMICQGLKGGTGTSSRVVAGFSVPDANGNASPKEYTVGVLVQANYGRLHHFRVSGVPVGRLILEEREKAAAQGSLTAEQAESARIQEEVDKAKDSKDGSIIIVIATDAPLHPLQLQRLAKRATGGLSRVGGYGHNPSGDIFLAFSTANEIPAQMMSTKGHALDVFKAQALQAEVTQDGTVNGLIIEAAADAVEEAIYNAICMAEAMSWPQRPHRRGIGSGPAEGDHGQVCVIAAHSPQCQVSQYIEDHIIVYYRPRGAFPSCSVQTLSVINEYIPSLCERWSSPPRGRDALVGSTICTPPRRS